MKKGFTLIELLAVIIVLGVVAVIAVPTFNNVVQSSRAKAFLETEKALIRGLRNYLNFNEDLYPLDNEVRVISISTLQNEKFISKIKSPTGSNCSGYVTIVKISDNQYEYKPQYRCDSAITINSVLDDGLVLDYNFDNFQEPTTNLIPNSPINSFPRVGNSHGTYNTNQYNNNVFFSIGTIGSITNNIVTLSSIGRTINTYDVLTPQTTGGGVTAGTRYYIKKLSANTFTLHAHDSSQDGSKGFGVYDSINNDQRININATSFPTMWIGPAHVPNSAIVKEIIPNCFSTLSVVKHECIRLHTSHKPDGVVDGMAYGVMPSAVAGRQYTFSFYYRAADESSVGRTIHLSAHTTTSWTGMGSAQQLTSEWKRYTVTATAPATGSTILYFWPSKNANVDISEIQFEEKPYATEFSITSRTGNVLDYSTNGNNFTLDPTLTPRWVGERSGSYYFGGNQYTLSNPSLTLNTFTFSTWVNPFYYGNSTSKTVTGLGSSANIFSLMRTAGTYSSGPFWLEYRQNGNLDVYLRNEAAATVRVVVPLLSVDEWTLLTVTYNHVTGAARVYLNGEFAVSATNIAAGSLGPIGRIYLGTGLGTGTTGTPYNGYIDEVKLYNRILSDSEIQNIYSIEKLK